MPADVWWTEAVSALEMPHPVSPPRWKVCCGEGRYEAEKYLLRHLLIMGPDQRHSFRHQAGILHYTQQIQNETE